jgi:hypothetical protein
MCGCGSAAVRNVATHSLNFVISTFFAAILQNKKRRDKTEELLCVFLFENAVDRVKLIQVCNYKNKE